MSCSILSYIDANVFIDWTFARNFFLVAVQRPDVAGEPRGPRLRGATNEAGRQGTQGYRPSALAAEICPLASDIGFAIGNRLRIRGPTDVRAGRRRSWRLTSMASRCRSMSSRRLISWW